MSVQTFEYIFQNNNWSYFFELFIITAMNNLKKPNRILLPTNENLVSPDLSNKYNIKNYCDLLPDPAYNHQKDISDSPNYFLRNSKNEDYFTNSSIPQLNIELDKNLNEIIQLLSRRKMLISAKKSKIMEDAQQKINQARQSIDMNCPEIFADQDFLKITNFCQNPHTAVKMLAKIVQFIPEVKGPRIDQQQRSEQFWARNRKLQNDIDAILQKLKTVDKQLQIQNGEVLQICRQLDRIEESLKSFVGTKSPDHVAKIEPLFNSKKKNYDILNRMIIDREVSKDKKIEFIKRIKYILEELKRTREERLNQIAHFFGVENSWEFQKMSFKDQGDFANGLEQLLKIKQRDTQLEISEKQVLAEMDLIEKEQDRIYNQLLKRLSDQAKIFHNFNSIQTQRIKNASILGLFQNQANNVSFKSIDPKEFLKKFKEIKNFFKRFLEQDALLKQGLMKTSETTKTFVNLLRSTQTQKERRHELLGLLEACVKKRGEYEQKKEELRINQFDQCRNDQSLVQFEEDLQAVLTDGDLQSYKKIGNAIVKCETEKTRLLQMKELLQKQMQSMDRDVLNIANRIQQQYQDILSDILPSDYQYSLRSGEDVKKLRNQLRKMYKRLGLLSNQ